MNQLPPRTQQVSLLPVSHLPPSRTHLVHGIGTVVAFGEGVVDAAAAGHTCASVKGIHDRPTLYLPRNKRSYLHTSLTVNLRLQAWMPSKNVCRRPSPQLWSQLPPRAQQVSVPALLVTQMGHVVGVDDVHTFVGIFHKISRNMSSWDAFEWTHAGPQSVHVKECAL